VRDLRSGATTLVSPPSHQPAAPARPAATRRAAIGTAAAPVVGIVDNAFVRGHEQPRLTVRPGTTVTWRWRSQSSHNVTVRSGPERFRATTRSRGLFRHRLSEPGVYRFVCTLHSPGMGITVVVR
jgi:plastocyanin